MVDAIALDPGVTTGIAIEDNSEFRSLEIRPDVYVDSHKCLFDILTSLQPGKIIYEAFHFRQNMNGVVFTGVEYIGVIELYAQLNSIKIVKITPSDGKGFWDNTKLRAIGVYNTAKPHGNDAMRILLRVKMKDSTWMKTTLEKLRDVL